MFSYFFLRPKFFVEGGHGPMPPEYATALFTSPYTRLYPQPIVRMCATVRHWMCATVRHCFIKNNVQIFSDETSRDTTIIILLGNLIKNK